MRTLYLDCFCGASGDMILGALIDLGAGFERIREQLQGLGVPGFSISAEREQKKGVAATQFRVHLDDSEKPHRHLRHIVEIIENAPLSEGVKAASRATFQHIAECEAEVHGTTIEKVHFHEVGAIDSIVDVIGAHLAMEALGNPRVIASPLPLGVGSVKCDHGLMPVPAPATALLAKGVPTYGGDVEAELTTPTGAALVSQLASAFGPLPSMRVERVGYGSGTRDLPDRPNVLRAFLGEAGEAGGHVESITVIEANIDDMQPELYPALVERLLAAGARDAFLTPIHGKKGRPGQLVTALCEEDSVNSVMEAFFENSTTLGARMRTERRHCLERVWETVETPWGAVRIKIGKLDGRVRSRKPEYEDCRLRAEEAGVSVLSVYQAALAAAGGNIANA